MPIERFFDANLNHDDTSGKLTGDQMHHALKVFRLKLHDVCEIINGHGLLAEVEIIEISKKHMSYRVTKKIVVPHKPPVCTLILGMPKFTRLETIVEKVCELGCDEIILFNADRSEKLDLSPNQLERLQLILQAALKQSGRLYLPHLELLPSLERALEPPRSYFFGDVDAHGTITHATEGPRAIVIGPESGFSKEETAILKEKAVSISLSDAVLRVDTAAIVGIFSIRTIK